MTSIKQWFVDKYM